jgi:hypothetical protein
MTTKNMLIIKNAYGEIIAAQVEDADDSEVKVFITPSDSQDTLYKVSDVPTAIYDHADPTTFQRAITDHVNSNHARVTLTTAEELHAAFLPEKKAGQ